MLTHKQYKLLVLINDRIRETGVAPSFEEMKNEVGLRSKSGIHRLVTSLVERGFIRRLPHRARALEVLRMPENIDLKPAMKSNTSSLFNSSNDNVDIPLYGKIAAGTPIDALRNETETMSVPSDMIRKGEHYALTIEGDSMIEAGILNGDIVVIKKTNNAENGEIVVALVDNEEATLKKIYKKTSSITLEPANRHYKTQIYAKERVTVQGKLVGLMRKYH